MLLVSFSSQYLKENPGIWYLSVAPDYVGEIRQYFLQQICVEFNTQQMNDLQTLLWKSAQSLENWL